MHRFLVLVMFVLVVSVTSSGTTVVSVAVPATSVIFAAGGNMDPAIAGGTGAVEAAAFTAGAGLTLTFSSITGTVGCWGDNVPMNGPDGICFTGTDTQIGAVNSISGTFASHANMFLVGAFLRDTPPTGAPPLGSYYADAAAFAQATYSPLLQQVFFIGDGLTGTGSGATQVFNVPSNATSLWLGFADALDFQGTASSYGDNTGQLSAIGTISGPADSVPEPGSALLIITGITGLLLLRCYPSVCRAWNCESIHAVATTTRQPITLYQRNEIPVKKWA